MRLETMANDKVRITNGVMQKLIVYDNGYIIGHGYIIVTVDGRMSRPTLLDMFGNELPSAWYQIQVTEEKTYVVIPKRIQ